jgi:H+-transporting ATPase
MIMVAGVADIVVLLALQILNGIIGFREEYTAGNAIGELKKAMVSQCAVLRDGEWNVCPSRELVPGDIVALKLGDVVPADCTIISGGPFEVDQSALTGESLSVTLDVGAVVLMGSAVKQGKGTAIVETTGTHTQLGRSAALVASVQVQDHLHLMLMRILVGLSLLASFVFAFTFIALLIANVGNDFNVPGSSNFLRALGISIAILISSIPVAMQIVATATLALGAHELTSRGVIVARLSCMEELAAMSVLCSDKTGTLTENKLTLYDSIPLQEGMSKDEVILLAALASEPEATQQDAIDSCITQALPMSMAGRFQSTTVLEFEHFNPVTKRSVAVVSQADGTRMRVMKGAPQAVAALCEDKNDRNFQANEVIGEFASRGYRALSIAASESETGPLQLVGVIALYDPPRADTVETIEQLLEFGITVKMITGDNLAIAQEMCHELKLGDNVVSCHQLDALEGPKGKNTDGIILNASGFAEAMPQHKFTIVEALRGTGCLVGMTGDGVNDAPALKRADVGIAVGGATDAARAAADLVLTKPGLAVIVDAIVASRQVFQRIRTYVLYKTAITVQISVFFFVSILLINPSNPYFYGPINPAAPNHNTAFTLPVTAIVIITILNDLCVISMSRDSVVANKLPGQWDLRVVLGVAIFMGLIQGFGSVLLLVIILHVREWAKLMRQ